MGGDSGREPLERREAYREVVDQLLPQARRTLHLLTPDLEGWLYDRAEVVDALRQRITSEQRLQCQLLLRDPRPALLAGHRLIGIAQRLSSYFAIRRLSDRYARMSECYLIIDRRAILFRPEADSLEGWVDCNAPAEARRLLERYDEAWNQSLAEPELRRL